MNEWYKPSTSKTGDDWVENEGFAVVDGKTSPRLLRDVSKGSADGNKGRGIFRISDLDDALFVETQRRILLIREGFDEIDGLSKGIGKGCCVS